MLHDIEHNLKQIRIDRGLSTHRVATYLGVSQRAYLRYEDGTRFPDIDSLIKLSELYQCQLDDLVLKQSDNPDLVSRDLVVCYRDLREFGVNDKLAHGLIKEVADKMAYDDLPVVSLDKKLKFVYRSDLRLVLESLLQQL